MANVTYRDDYADGEIGVFNEIDIRGLANGRHSQVTMQQRLSGYGTAAAAMTTKAIAIAAKVKTGAR